MEGRPVSRLPAAGGTPTPSSPETARRDRFEHQVRNALMHLQDYPRLRTHSLARFVHTEPGSRPVNLAVALHDRLVGTIEALKPGPDAATDPNAWRCYLVLRRHYVEGRDAATVQGELAISPATYYREHQRALTAVAALLAERWALDLDEAGTTPRQASFPLPLTSFVGRERELAAVLRALTSDSVRLVTLTGTPGSGKTRLAQEALRELAGTFPDGAHLVPLAPVVDAPLVLPTLARALGVRDIGERPLALTLRAAIGNRHMLLVLDNFEQVLSAAPLLVELLGYCPRLKVLITSRAPLRVRGERVIPVPPLSLPDDTTSSRDAIAAREAVRLFVERAQDLAPDFTLTDENAPAVAELCRRLDGLPLALELAAAWVRVLSPAELLGRLGHRLLALAGHTQDLPARQQSLDAAIDWSYALLSDAEQRLFRRLAVFAGGWSMDAAAAICDGAGDLGVDILEGLVALVDQSLVRQSRGWDGSARFGTAEIIHEYARERLEAHGEATALYRAHADFFLNLAETAARALEGNEQAVWLERLEREDENLRAALRRAIEAGTLELGARFGGALWQYWLRRGHFSEGRHIMEWLGEHTDGVAPRVRVATLRGAGALALHFGDYAAARRRFEESLRLARNVGDDQGTGAALHALGVVARHLGKHVDARRLFDESLGIQRAVGDRRGAAASLHNLGLIARDQGDHRAARAFLEEGLAAQRDVGDQWGAAASLQGLAVVLRDQGDFVGASDLLEESLKHRVRFGDRPGIAGVLHSLGVLARHRGDRPKARELIQESLALRRAMGIGWGIAASLQSLGLVAWEQDDFEMACASLTESLAQWRTLGDIFSICDCLVEIATVACAQGQFEAAACLLGARASLIRDDDSFNFLSTAPRLGPLQERIWAAMGQDPATAAWERGRSMTPERAVAHATAREDVAAG